MSDAIEKAIQSLKRSIDMLEDFWIDDTPLKTAIEALQVIQRSGTAVAIVYADKHDGHTHGRRASWLTNPEDIPDNTKLYTSQLNVPEAKVWNQAEGRDGKLYVVGWNACRDAMLSATRGSRT
jgi:hypothetical protein